MINRDQIDLEVRAAVDNLFMERIPKRILRSWVFVDDVGHDRIRKCVASTPNRTGVDVQNGKGGPVYKKSMKENRKIKW